ncbi:MAG: 2-hydroxychromene-2-carboxylate isomerase [Deltaproteobacteria bacterium]|nr:2-hydroxychromene-2-carboxylate isomerase [Deltaproteobacteria bacterium]
MSTRLEFFYDYGSPYSYLASSRLEALAERTGCEVVYRPMLLGGVFKATGNQSPALQSVEAKRRYGGNVMQRWVEYLGIDFQFNPFFPINTLPIMRAAHAAQRAGVFEDFHRAVYPAFWAQAKNLGDPEVFAEVLRGAGLDAKQLIEGASDPAVKNALREATDEAVARGAFGAPTFFVGDEMFFGNDQLDFVERALTAS